MPKLQPTDFPVQVTLTVQWGEMDSFQHVNNIMYFRYFETSRIEYFKQMRILDNPTIGPILAKTNCTFIFPLTFPDEIVCTSRVIETLEDRFVMEYAIFSQRRQRIAAKGQGVIVPFNYVDQCKVSLPENWSDEIQRIESVKSY